MPAPIRTEKLQWDVLPVAGTRPAMKGGVPFWAIMPIFFIPCVLVLLTFRWWFLILVPGSWFLVGAAFVGNPNRPFEWIMFVMSGSFWADWSEWGGVSCDPHGSTKDTDYHP